MKAVAGPLNTTISGQAFSLVLFRAREFKTGMRFGFLGFSWLEMHLDLMFQKVIIIRQRGNALQHSQATHLAYMQKAKANSR